jgi:hypothetical protein
MATMTKTTEKVKSSRAKPARSMRLERLDVQPARGEPAAVFPVVAGPDGALRGVGQDQRQQQGEKGVHGVLRCTARGTVNDLPGAQAERRGESGPVRLLRDGKTGQNSVRLPVFDVPCSVRQAASSGGQVACFQIR